MGIPRLEKQRANCRSPAKVAVDTCSHAVFQQSVIAGADVAEVGAYEQTRLATPEVGHVDVTLPYRTRWQATRLQLEPFVTDDDGDCVRPRHFNLSRKARGHPMSLTSIST
jgi:hypothetical protein